MSSDTGPGEIAKILANDKTYREWVVLSLIELKSENRAFAQKLDQHIKDDEKFQYEISRNLGNVSSSANDYEKNKLRVDMVWKVLAGIGGFVGVIWIVFEAFAKFIAWVKSGTTP